MNTLYDLLGALPHDDAEGLRSAFRNAVKGAHPDLRPDDPDAALRFREIVRANEILGDTEQRAAYDHLLELAHLEQDQVSRQQAVFTRIHRLASGVVAFAGISIMTAGGYLLFMHMSAASVAPLDEVDTAVRASPAIAAVSPAVPPDAADKGALSAKREIASLPRAATAPSAAMPQIRTESLPPAAGGPAPDLVAIEARSLRARGMSALRNGDLNGAIADLDQALQLDPRFLPAYIDRGTVLYRMRRIGRAFADIAPAKPIEKSDRSKSAPATAGKSGTDQAAPTGPVTPLPQRRKIAQKPSREDAYTPLWVR
jgi:tetratricopeptide (TPR) repeat protein